MNLNFPQSKSFLINLILQRTSPLLKLGQGEALFKWVNSGNITEIEGLIGNKVFLDKYLSILIKEISLEVDELVEHFKEFQSSNLVSIGPGNGLIELILLKRLPIKNILLIDIEKTNSHHHSFFSEGSGYASLEETKKFIEINGINSNAIICCNPNDQTLPVFRIDILISLFSMGFHYPCNTYLNFITKNSKSNSILCFDKRQNVKDPGYENILKDFKLLKSKDFKKYKRVFLIKEKKTVL